MNNSYTGTGRREFLKGLVGMLASSQIPQIAKGHENKEDELIQKFGLTGTTDENLEVVKNLKAEGFHELYDSLVQEFGREKGFEKLRNLIRYTSPHWFPTGHERVENMRRLLPLINEYSNRFDFSSIRTFSHAFVESGGNNNLNSENGGGVMQLKDFHWNGINPLNEEQNIMKGVEYLSRLKNEFKYLDIASLAFNVGDGIVRHRVKKIRDHLDYKGIESDVTPEMVLYMFRGHEGRDYLRKLEEAWNKVTKEKLFDYVGKKNIVRYIGSKDGIKLRDPETSGPSIYEIKRREEKAKSSRKQ